MNSWRAILFHLILVSIQPAYLGRLLFKHGQHQSSPIWLATVALSWVWFITVVTIPFFTSPLRHLPMPKGEVFPFGHARILSKQPATTRFLEMCKDTPNDGLLAFWSLFYIRRQVVPTTPTAMMDVLNTRSYDWHKPGLTKKLLARILGDGIINVEGDTHKAMRKVVAPAFSGRHIRELTSLFYTKGVEFANTIPRSIAASPDGTIEVMSQMSRVTLDIIGAAAVGKEFNTIHNGEDHLANLYATITDTNRGPVLLFFFINVLLPQWIVRNLYGTVYARVVRAQEELRHSIRLLLADKKRDMKEKPSTEQKDIIAIIMRSGDFSDDYLCSQLLTFLAAGHDTTASALTWTIHLFTENHAIQERLYEECKSHLLGLDPSTITPEIFDKMPYLTAVCNETLRLYPTVPITVRHAATNTVIDGTPIPKGTNVLISMWTINRLPSLWGPDADEYRPDRWLKGPLASTGGADNAYSMMTFLHGPRSCIGQGFARLEMKCVLAAMVLRYKFEKAESQGEVEVGGFITIKPSGGLKVRCIERDIEAS